MSGLTFTDIFCGAGGSSIGLTDAGLTLSLAANHWSRAIETHSANFTKADHLCADVNNYDMRRLPKTDILWASPICTEISPAGGRRRRQQRTPGQGDLLEEAGYISPSAYDRTRATAYDVIRATEVHRYTAVLIENVVEFATDWELFPWWLDGMVKLGYNHQTVSVSSAHVGDETNPWAPQWRDRLYVVFTRKGIPLPDVSPHPHAWCADCSQIVRAVQWWKDPRKPKIGKYRTQYLYRCPNSACKHDIVEPYVLPAATAIDWSDLGMRIGDKPLRAFKDKNTGEVTWAHLAPATTRRIKTGLQMFAAPAEVATLNARVCTGGDALATPPLVVNTNHDDDRTYPAVAAPLATRSTKIGDGIVTPPFLVDRRDYNGSDSGRVRSTDEPMGTVTAAGRTVRTLCVPEPFVTMLRNNQTAAGVDEPVSTISAAGRHHGLTVPPGAFLQKHHGGLDYERIEHMTKDAASEPMPSIVARPNVSLVIPYRRATRPTTTDSPLPTVATREHAALLQVAIDVDDCHFRMLKPREHLRAQRFADDYIVTGNQGEQTMQAGNAVSANVANWIARQVLAALDSRAAQ